MTTDAKHTDALLEVSGVRALVGGRLVLTIGPVGGTEWICAVLYSGVTDDLHVQSHADAERLAAAWNACAGIPTEQLEKGCVEKQNAALRAARDTLSSIEASLPEHEGRDTGWERRMTKAALTAISQALASLDKS